MNTKTYNTHLGFKYPLPSIQMIIYAMLLYFIIFLIYSRPLAFNFIDGFISPLQHGDSPVFIWNTYQFYEAVSNGENPFYTCKQLLPVGGNVIMHSNTLVFALVNLIFNNPEFSVNLVLMLSFVLSGLGAFLLSYKINRNIYWSLLAGFIFSFGPYKTAHLTEHFNLMLTAVIPFFALAVNRCFEFIPNKLWPRKIHFKWLIWTFILGLIALGSDYYTSFFIIYYVLFICFYNAYVFDFNWKFNKLKFWVKAVAIVAFFHFLISFLIKHADDKAAFWLGGDLAQFFIPSHNSFWFGGQYLRNFKDTIQPYAGSIEYEMFLGWTFSLFVLFILIKSIKPTVKISLMTFLSLVFFSMCLPAFKVMGNSLFNMPTSVFHFIPFFNHVHVPPRIVLMLSLVLPLAVSTFLTELKIKNSISVIFFLLLFVEFLPKSFHMITPDKIPEWVAKVKSSDAEVLIPVPTGLRDGLTGYGQFSSNHLYYQTKHHKPLVGGYLSRLPVETYDYYKDSLGLNETGCFDSTILSKFPNAVWVIDTAAVSIPCNDMDLNKYENYSY